MQDPQLVAVPDDLPPPAMILANVENNFSTEVFPHSGHETSLLPKTSFSNSFPQSLHRYSNIGIGFIPRNHTMGFMVIIPRRSSYLTMPLKNRALRDLNGDTMSITSSALPKIYFKKIKPILRTRMGPQGGDI